jgi:hypothetical protein
MSSPEKATAARSSRFVPGRHPESSPVQRGMNIVQRWMNFDSMCKKSGPSTNTDTRLRRAGLFAAVQGWLPSSTPLPRVLACENIAALTKLGEVTLTIIRIIIKATLTFSRAGAQYLLLNTAAEEGSCPLADLLSHDSTRPTR